MLRDKVKKYYDKSYDLNCAETILYAANEEYNLHLEAQTLKTMAAFGGGMGIGSVCGACTGALAVLGIIFTKDRAHESDKIRNLSQRFLEEFYNKLGTLQCTELTEKYKNDIDRCSTMIYEAADILDKIINRK